eukprot:jgi/Mesvir1/22046/Mv12701-RA.1
MASVITAPVDVANKVTESVGDAASATAKKVGFVREDGKLAPMFAVTLAVMMGLSVFTATDSLIAGMFPSTATGGKRCVASKFPWPYRAFKKSTQRNGTSFSLSASRSSSTAIDSENASCNGRMRLSLFIAFTTASGAIQEESVPNTSSDFAPRADSSAPTWTAPSAFLRRNAMWLSASVLGIEKGSTVAETYGNPSSSHEIGKVSRSLVEKARADIARDLRVPARSVLFTSGATESMNIVLQGVMEKHGFEGVVLTSAIEHPAGIKPLEHLKKEHGDKITIVRLPVDAEGFVKMEALREAVDKYGSRVKLASIIYANNEIGTIQDLCAIRRVIGDRVHFHSDTTQAAGKFPLKGFRCLDSFVVSGHKIHSVKGVGALVLRKSPSCLAPLTYGGGQERAVRPGTESPPLIAALAEAVRVNRRHERRDVARIRALRGRLVADLEKMGAVVHGPKDEKWRLPNLVSAALPVRSSRALVARLAKRGIAISTGSACHLKRRSETLKAIGLPRKLEMGTVRIGLSAFTSYSELRELINRIFDSGS